jgi:hypothetical protein
MSCCKLTSAGFALPEALERRALLSAVTGFSLVNADTDQVIAPLTTGQVVDLAVIGTNRINVVAATDGDVASVRFANSGDSAPTVDSSGAFCAAGDTGSGDYGAWAVASGAYTLTAVPFQASDATGQAGAAMGVVFYVVDSTPPAPADGEVERPRVDQSPNILPAVQIVSPQAGEHAPPGYYVVRADASDADGSVAKVEYFANDALIGTATAAPYMVSWTNVPAGTYALTAVAYDNRGASTSSAAVTVTLVAPVAGQTYFVSADTGNDHNAGTAESPFQTISAAADEAGPGDTVLIAPGIYRESIALRNGGTATQPLTFAAQTPGSVTIDGRDSDSGKAHRDFLMKPSFEGRADHVILSGLKFRFANNDPGNHAAAVQTGNDWRVEDCSFRKADGNGLGILGNDVTVLRVFAEDNGCAGIGGSGFSNVLVQDTISRRNNTTGVGGGSEGGGGKWTRADGLLIERFNSYDNDGPGIWFDIENINVTIRDSALHHNFSLYRKDGSTKIDGIGMFLEISGVVSDSHGKAVRQGPIVAENNLIYDNESKGVLIYATRNVTLRNNVLANNDVFFKDQRPTPHENRDVQIIGNRFQNARITADDYTAADGWQKKHFDFDANVFDNLDGRVYRWGNASYDSVIRLRDQLGFELNGSRGTVTFDPVVVSDPEAPVVA